MEESGTRYNCADSSVCARVYSSLGVSPPIPLGTARLLEFQLLTVMPDGAAAHLPRNDSLRIVHLAALRVGCFSGSDTRPESQ